MKCDWTMVIAISYSGRKINFGHANLKVGLPYVILSDTFVSDGIKKALLYFKK